jgi:mannitol-1-phosphate/altronate dehydrogenase
MQFLPKNIKREEDATTNFVNEFYCEVPERILFFNSGQPGELDLSRNEIKSSNSCIGTVVMVQTAGSLVAERCKIKNAIISRVLLEREQWLEILACARNPHLEVIITEKISEGEDILRDNIQSVPPFSFPGKLLTLLLERYKYFSGASDKGLTIILRDKSKINSQILESTLLELAHLNSLEPSLLDWIEGANRFCNDNFGNKLPQSFK